MCRPGEEMYIFSCKWWPGEEFKGGSCLSCRWWPGEVVSPDAIPDNLSSKKPGPCMFVVKFYGTHDYCWTFHGRVLPYTTEGGAIGEGVDKRTVCAEDFIKGKLLVMVGATCDGGGYM